MVIRARRLLRVAVFLALFVVGLGVFALVAIRTAWFKDWLRGYVSSEASRFLNGELTIGRLDGNLLTGVELENVSIRQNGETVVAVKNVGVDYSLMDLFSSGLMLDDIRITQPRLVLRRTRDGWNLGRLVKAEAMEADREGPGRPVRVGSIGISDGSATIEDTTAADPSALPLPRHITRIDFKGRFAYEPVDFTVEVAHLSLRADDPALALNSLSGKLATRGDDVHVDKLAVRTDESSLEVSGVVKNYLKTPVIQAKLRSDRTTLREIASFVPALSSIDLHPAYEISLDGPLVALKTELAVRSEAGAVTANVVANLESDRPRLHGSARADHIRLENVTDSLPSSDVTATATFNVSGQDTTSMTGTFDVELAPSSVAGYRADAARVSARLKGHQVDVNAAARAYGASAKASGVVGLPRSAGGTATANLRGQVSGVNLARLPRGLGAPAIQTRLSGDYRVETAGSRTDGQVVFSSSSVEGATIGAGTTVTGRLDEQRFTAKATGRVEAVDVARIGRSLGRAELADERLADASITSATFDLAAAGRVGTTESGSPKSGSTVSGGTMSGGGRVEIAEARALGGTLRDVVLEARVEERGANGSLTGRFQELDLVRASGRQDLEGTVSGLLDANVTVPDWRNPALETASGSARLELDPTRVKTVALDKAALRASIDAGTIDVQQLEVRSNVADAEASGRVVVAEPKPESREPEGESREPRAVSRPSALTYKAVIKDAAAAGALAGLTGVSGTAAIEGEVTGTRDDLATKGSMTATNLRYEQTAGAMSVTAKYDVAMPALAIEKLRAHVETEATVVKAAGTDLDSLGLKATYADRALDFGATVRQADRGLEGGGRLELQTSGMNLRLDKLSIAAPDVAWQLAAPAQIEYVAPRLTMAPVSMRSGAQELSVAGTVSLGADASSTSAAADTPLSLRAANIDLSSIDKLAGMKRGLAGRLDATMTVSGTMAAPRADGTLTIQKGAVDTFRFDRVTATVKADDRETRVDARLDQQPGTWLDAKAALPTVATLRAGPLDAAPIDARITSSSVDLGLIQSFTTAVRDVTGTLEANVHVTGTMKAPSVQGQVRAQNGAFTLTAAETAFKGLDAQIALNGSHVEIQSFRVLDPDGKPLTVSGRLTLPGAQSAAGDLRLKADDFSVMDSRLGELAVDADLHVRGTLGQQVRVDGEVAVHQGRLEVDRLLERYGSGAYSTEPGAPLTVDVPPVGSETRTTKRPEPAPKAAPSQQAAGPAPKGSPPGASQGMLVDNIVADVRLRIPNNLVLRGDNLRVGSGGLGLGDVNITVGGEIRTSKPAGGRPVVVGTIRTVRGFYEFQGRRFVLQRDGSIGFKGPDPTDPALDITALRDISGVDAIVRVTGTAQRPELELSSRPPLDEADILSLIIFNRPMNELGEGERTALAQRAGSMLGTAVAGPVAEALRDALDLDLLEISPMAEGASSPSVTVGNQVGERVFIKVRQQFGSSSASALLLEYELNELLRLQTNVTEGDSDRSSARSAEQSGVDLIFVVRY